MTAPRKQLVYFDAWQDPIAGRILAERPEMEIRRLTYEASEEENFRLLAEAHGYQVLSARDELPAPFFVTAGLLSRCPRLLVVSTHGAGYDTVDVAACSAAGVIVVNQAGGNREAVAEHVLAMMLTLSKRLIEADRRLRRERNFTRRDLIGNNIHGKTLGLVGLGNVGSRVAELCRGPFAMRVLAYDPYLTAEQFAARCAEPASLESVLEESDFVAICCPRTSETEGMIDAAAFARMRPSAFFINTARGGIHDELALERALADRRLAGAGLDVWAVEPPPLDHPLLGYDTVITSPHTAGVTQESRHEIATIAAEQLIAVFRGERPPRLVNPEAWPAYARRFAETFGVTPA